MTTPTPTAGHARGERGINLIGHLCSPSGLGQSARLFAGVLRDKGYTVAGYDVDAYAATEPSPLEAGLLKSTIDELPFENNLVVTTISRLPQMWLRYAKGLINPRFRNAGLLYWELPVIPPAWVPSLQMFDALVTCSQYVRQTIEAAVPEVPTVHFEHPLNKKFIEPDRTSTRRRFGIPLEHTAYFCGLDLSSLMARKNPLASILAWTRAFPDEPKVCLVIKLNGNVMSNSHYNPAIDGLLEKVRNDPRIILINERVSESDLMALYSCCDVFVSLHRSEGLGLIPMEAMSMGKVVVATGYSGNMSFMTEQNSLPVAYRLVSPGNDVSFEFSRRFAGRNACWAEPNIDHAITMLKAARDPETAAEISAQARADIAGRQRVAWRGHGIEQMIDLLGESDRVHLRSGLRRRILFQEIFNTDLRRKNIRKALLELKR